MFKGHPKGLYVAFFANMGERFGFYTMMAILVLYLQAKFGLSGENAGYIYSTFYFSIYALALVGGFIADRNKKYKGTIFVGIFTMLAGYLLMSVPGMGLVFACLGLFVIAFGNGLFKGNLQAVVGQLYDDPKYAKLRDSAYSVFYMGINIGAFFAPSAAKGIKNWYLKTQGLANNADLPALCHQYVDGTLANTERFQTLADVANGGVVADLGAFAQRYIDAFGQGYNYAFAIAAGAMTISLIVYLIFKRHLPDVHKAQENGGAPVVELSKEETRLRMQALFLVFGVVIFFWMAFHQNGLTLTTFARDYTAKSVGPATNMMFDIKAFLSVIAAILGIVLLVRKNLKPSAKLAGGILTAVGGYLAYTFYMGFPAENPISPETFQHFNPIFIVFLTPVVVGFFGWLNKRNIEPSTPKKIGFGMIITAIGFLVMVIGSFSLMSQPELIAEYDGLCPDGDRISPYWLMNTYLILTIAELFLSPMGISFVSKVSPPKYQGLMQGGWLGATALGNQLLFVGTLMYARFAVWQVWSVFIVCCLVAAAFIFSIMKRLEKVSK